MGVEKHEKMLEMKAEAEKANGDDSDSEKDKTDGNSKDAEKSVPTDDIEDDDPRTDEEIKKALMKEREEESFTSDRWLRIVEKKACLFKRSYLLSKFALGEVFFDWRPEFDEHMKLDAPNFLFPDTWYRNKQYAASRQQRREKFAEQMEQQMMDIVENYGYDENGNLVPIEELK